MNLLRSALPLAAVLAAVAATEASAQQQTVTLEVQAINQMSVSGDPGALTISTAAAGSAPTSVSDASTTYAITTNQTGTKITGAVDAALPSGVTLGVALAAPSGAASTGSVALTTTDADLVTGITKLADPSKSITYTLAATPAAGVVASTSRTVTFTVVAGT